MAVISRPTQRHNNEEPEQDDCWYSPFDLNDTDFQEFQSSSASAGIYQYPDAGTCVTRPKKQKNKKTYPESGYRQSVPNRGRINVTQRRNYQSRRR